MPNNDNLKEYNAIVAANQSLSKELKSDRTALRSEVRKLRKEVLTLAVKNGKQEIKIRFYRDTKWLRDCAVVALTCLGLIPLFFPEGLPVYIRWVCFGFVCIAATSYFWGMWFGRMNADDL